VHVICRFAFRADLAMHEDIKAKAIQLILDQAERRAVIVHQVVILDNHIHLIVTEPFVDYFDRLRQGISPFMRNWESDLSLALRTLGLIGTKFEGRFKSYHLKTLEADVITYAYLLGQAVHHNANPEHIIISNAVLSGEIDGITDVVPRIFRTGSNAEQANWFGALLHEVLDNAIALADGHALELQRDSAEVRRQRRQDLVQARESRAARDRRFREMDREDWRQAAQVALWNYGFDSELPMDTVDWISLQSVAPERWSSARGDHTSFRMPKLEVTHLRAPGTQRVHTTCVQRKDLIPSGAVEIVWTVRMSKLFPD
jgi:REP element-mobilizing transposase RayT